MPTESLQMCMAEECLAHTQVFEWHKMFREGGREDLADDARSGRLPTSRHEDNIRCVKELVRADRQRTVRMAAEELVINKSTVWSKILECRMRTPKWYQNS